MEIPVEILRIDPHGYHLFVAIQWRGKALRMLVDTGASRTVLGRLWMAAFAANLPVMENEEPSYGINSEALVTSQVYMEGLEYNGHPFPPCTLSIIDLEGVNRLYGTIGVPLIDGILGADWLVDWHAELDLQNARIRFNFKFVGHASQD